GPKVSGRRLARRMIGQQDIPSNTVPDALRHAPPHRAAVGRLRNRWPITTNYPDDIGRVFIPLSKKAAVLIGVFLIEYDRSLPPNPGNLIAPGREQSNVQALLLRLGNNPVYQFEIRFIRLLRVQFIERNMTIAIGNTKAVHFCKYDRLNDIKSLGLPVFKIPAYFFFG